MGAARMVTAEQIEQALEAIAQRALTVDEQNLISVYARSVASQLVERTLGKLSSARLENRADLAAEFVTMLENLEDRLRSVCSDNAYIQSRSHGEQDPLVIADGPGLGLGRRDLG